MRYAIWFSAAVNFALVAMPVDGWPWWSRAAGIVGLALTWQAWRSFKSEPSRG